MKGKDLILTGTLMTVLGVAGYIFLGQQLVQYQNGLVQFAIGLGNSDLASRQAQMQGLQVLSAIVAIIGVVVMVVGFFQRAQAIKETQPSDGYSQTRTPVSGSSNINSASSFCSSCGAKAAAEDRFCEKCGSTLGG
ncbi:MAG: zinc ribbon domain-containing protein [Actinomycetota bacterium]